MTPIVATTQRQAESAPLAARLHRIARWHGPESLRLTGTAAAPPAPIATWSRP